MSTKPTRATPDGRAYLDLQNLARRTKRPTDELHQLYALECFLDRLSMSSHASRFVLKGGVLLPAYATRRPTRDIDLAARALDNEVETIRALVRDVVEIDIEDGLEIDRDSIAASVIREEDLYSGVRVTVAARLASARLQFHVDVNVGDPISPAPESVALPRLLGGELNVVGYPLVMVLAEKIVTALQRGVANTRWRDFTDVSRLIAIHELEASVLLRSMRVVAEHRAVELEPLSTVLDGYADVAQPRWAAWRRKQQLTAVVPEQFARVVAELCAFADPLITGEAEDLSWSPDSRAWIAPPASDDANQRS